MALTALVKISSVTNLSDARYVAGMGVEMIGFDLEEHSSRYVAPEDFNAITSWVSGVKLVGEIAQVTPEKLKRLTGRYTLDYIQVSDLDSAGEMTHWPVPLIFKIDRADENYLEKVFLTLGDVASWFLLELENHSLSDSLLNSCGKWSPHYPIILGTDVRMENVFQILNLGVSGIALPGGQEVKPGYKDFDGLADVLEVLEADDTESD